MDSSLSKELTKVFKKSGVKVNTSHKVSSIERKGESVFIVAENKKGESDTFEDGTCNSDHDLLRERWTPNGPYQIDLYRRAYG